MPAQLTVIYPSDKDATFDMDYYMKTHMPLVMDTWESEGMTGWNVSKFVGAAGGGESPYSVQALLRFKSVEAFQTAVSGEGAKKIIGDIPNFTNLHPIMMIGEVQGEVDKSVGETTPSMK